MAKAVLSVVGANMGSLRCSRVVSSSTALRLLLPPTSSSSCLRIRPKTTTTNNSYSSSLGLGLGLGLVVLNPGERRVASAPIAMVSTTKSETHLHRHVGSRRSLNTTIPATNTPHHHHVNDSGSIDSSLINSMQTKIKEQLNAESVIVKDAYGDGRHVSIDVISSAFEGESAVSRQRMVYKAIWEELQNTVHAVDQMTTKTPSEAATNK